MTVAIIGAGPYGLSLAAHLAARKQEHRIIGHPMLFWSRIAKAGTKRYLKSYCFGTNISSPTRGSSFVDFSEPRGLETFEPCSIEQFVSYGLWFQKKNVGWVEQQEVENICKVANGFAIVLSNGENFLAGQVVLATGLSRFAYIPPILASLPADLLTHTSDVTDFARFAGTDVAVIGGGQSALEAAALLREGGARPHLLVREERILWNTRITKERGVWQRLRSPISGLGTGPKAWALTNFPYAAHRLPSRLRTRFVRKHLPAEGAWWLRKRVEDQLPIYLGVSVLKAREKNGRVELRLGSSADAREYCITVDHIVAGTGYDIDVNRISYLSPKLRTGLKRLERAPRLNAQFESSIPGLKFVGPASAMSFGPLFRFVVGAEYTARIVSADLALRRIAFS